MQLTARKLLSLLLATMLVLSGIPAFAQESEDLSLGLSGTITAFAEINGINVDNGTALDDVLAELPATVEATLLPDGEAAVATQTDIPATGWSCINDGGYTADVDGFYSFEPTLDLPENVTLGEGVEQPYVVVTVGNPQAGIMPLADAPAGAFNFTSTHAAAETYSDGSGGTATWNGSSTLTLTDFDYAPTGVGLAITLPANSTIVLSGTNTITLQNYGASAGVINFLGTLTIKEESGTPGSIEVVRGSNRSGYSRVFYSSTGTLTVESGSIITATDNVDTSTFSVADMSVTGGSIEVSAGDKVFEITNSLTVAAGLEISASSDKNGSGASVVSADTAKSGSYKYIKIGPASGGITPPGGAGIQHGYYALAWNDIVNAGDTIVAERAATGSAGLRFKTPDGTNIVIPNVSTNDTGNVVMSANGASVTVPSDYPTYRVSATQGDPQYYLTFTAIDAPAPATDDFSLKFAKVDGAWKLQKITDEDPPEDYTATGISFSGDTLTLNDFSFTTSAASALQTGDGARMVLNGTSTIKATDGGTSEGPAILGSGNLSISGTGTLNANSGIVMQTGDFSMSSGTVNAVATVAAQDSRGLTSMGGDNIRVSGGTLNVKGDEYGILTSGPIYVEGSGKITAEGDQTAIMSANYATAPTAVTIQGKQAGGTLGTVVWTEFSGDGGSIYFYSTDGTLQTVATYVELSGGTGSTDSGSSSSDSGSSGSSSTTTVSAPNPWLEPNPAQTLSNDTSSKNSNIARTKSTDTYGVRKNSWSKFEEGQQYRHDTMDGNAVAVRLYINNPTAMNRDTYVTGHVKGNIVEKRKAFFEKWFSNKVQVIHMDESNPWGQQVEIAAKVDLTGMDTDNLYIYSYNAKTNSYTRVSKEKYWIDKNGYLHFYTELAGDIIISENPLEKR